MNLGGEDLINRSEQIYMQFLVSNNFLHQKKWLIYVHNTGVAAPSKAVKVSSYKKMTFKVRMKRSG